MTGFMMEFIFTIFGRLDNVLLNDRTCIQANTIEGHVWLSVILLVAENLTRTRDSSLNYSTPSGKINVAISGVTLLIFTTIDLFFFSFSDTQACQLCPPEFWDNIWRVHPSAEFFILHSPGLSRGPGRGVSLARCAGGPGFPAGPALLLGGPAQVGGH